METRNKQIIEYLQKNSDRSVDSSELSKYFGVSTRQIRNYIKAINDSDSSQKRILSSSNGYRVNKDYHVIDNDQENTPQHRRNIMVQMMLTHPEGIKKRVLIENLHISESTLLNDIKLITNHIGNELTIKNTGDGYCMEGSETAKRRLISQTLFEDKNNKSGFSADISNLIDYYDMRRLRQSIVRIIASYNVYANDYCLNNILVHIMIMIERTRTGFIVPDSVDLTQFKDTLMYNIATDIIMYVSDLYNIQFKDGELFNLIVILENNITRIDYSRVNYSNLGDYIDKEYIELTKQIIVQIEKDYMLDSFDNSFLCLFTIHIQNMLLRCKNGYKIKNPLAGRIKVESPIIYDIAVSIAQMIQERTGVLLNDDEITYISFHIGSYIENSLQNKEKMTATFIYADYYNNYSAVYNRLLWELENELLFKRALSILDFVPEKNKDDIIISTSKIDMDNAVFISPFLSESDFSRIRSKISELNNMRSSLNFKNSINRFISEETFFVDRTFSNKEEAIHVMSQNVLKLGFVKDTFEESVLRREKMSSTDYSTVAIPHSLGKDVIKSFISVSIQNKPMQWSENKVRLILLLGAASNDTQEYKKLFNNLIFLFLDNICVNELASCKNYDEFIQMIVSKMEQKKL